MPVTGNATAFDGIQPGVTEPNLSTRPSTQINQTVGLANATTANVGQDLQEQTVNGTPVANGGFANASLSATATTVTGTPTTATSTVPSFGGATAVSANTVVGILNAPVTIGRDVLTSTGTLGNFTGSAQATATSTASVVTGSNNTSGTNSDGSAAAVVDIASIGLQASRVSIGQDINTLSLSGKVTGNATASGVTAGDVSNPGAPPSGPLTGEGVNSILNLNARGLSPQTQYFQDPISPFFAEFSGLPTFVDSSGTPEAPIGIAATNQVTDNNGTLLFNGTSGAALTGISPGQQISTLNSFFGFTIVDINGAPIPTTNTVSPLVAQANQFYDNEGQLIYTAAPAANGSNQSTLAATFQSSPTAVADTNGNSIFIGRDGDVEATGEALGNSTSSNVTGDTNAFAGIFSTGATLIGDITIGRNGDIVGKSGAGFQIGSSLGTFNTAGKLTSVNSSNDITTTSTATTGASSALTNILSVGLGTAAVREPSPTATTSIGSSSNPVPNGSFDAVAPAELTIGSSGDVIGEARAVSNTKSTSTTGDAVAFTGGLASTGGNTFANSFSAGNSLTVGIFNLDVTGGGTPATTNVSDNDVRGDAIASFTTEANTTTGAAKTNNSSITSGIFGANFSSGSLQQTDIFLGNNGTVTGYADAFNTSRTVTTTGASTAATNSTTTGISNVDIDLGRNGDITAAANSTDVTFAQAVTSTSPVLATGINTTTGIFGSDLRIGSNGDISAIANASNTVTAKVVTGSAQALANQTVIGIGNTPIFIGGSGSLVASATLVSSATSN